MWDCIVNFSTWAEGNSGQIQIVIAVVALIYAWKAYHKVLEQIEISNNQTEIANNQNQKANEQRALDLKIKILDELFKSLEIGRGLEAELNDLIFEFELLKRDLENEVNTDNKTSIESFEKIITGYKSNTEQLKLNNDNLVNLISIGAKADILELDFLNNNLTETMMLRLLDIKTHSNQKLMRVDLKKYRSTMSN